MVSAIRADGRDIRIALRPAYVHRASSGWVQDLDLLIGEATVSGVPRSLPIEISEGSLTLGGAVWPNMFPIVSTPAVPVVLDLLLISGESVAIHGRGLDVQVRGEARYVEPLPTHQRV